MALKRLQENHQPRIKARSQGRICSASQDCQRESSLNVKGNCSGAPPGASEDTRTLKESAAGKNESGSSFRDDVRLRGVLVASKNELPWPKKNNLT